MRISYIKDKFNREVAVFEFSSPIHERVVMSKHNLYNHIISTHPEITIEILREVIEVPEKIYEVYKKEKLWYYEKSISNQIYLVVVGERTKDHYKKVMTAFQLTDFNKNRFNRIHCIYDSEDIEETEEELIEKMQQDKDYFYKLFNS